jgi:hypothetical protein
MTLNRTRRLQAPDYGLDRMSTGYEDRVNRNTAIMKKYFDLKTVRRITGQKDQHCTDEE